MSKAVGWHRDTALIRSGIHRTGHQETSEALFMTSGYVYKTAEEAAAAFRGETDNFVYSRYGNPTLSALEDRLAKLEGAECCRVCSTGMAAIFAAMACQLSSGDRVVASWALFGACHAILTKILPRWGIKVELLDGRDLNAWKVALSQPAKLVFFETPSNPLLHLVDIEAVSLMAHAAGAKVIVDNVFATPLFQSPLTLGADIVTYSTTKHIDGQGRLLGGAVLGQTEFIEKVFLPFYRHTGAAMSAFNAWVMLKSLETLALRVEMQTRTATQLTEIIKQHPAVLSVSYPGDPTHPQYALASRQMSGASTLISFEVKGDRNGAFRFLNALKLVDISNNLGDSKTLACHPASTTHVSLSKDERLMLEISESHVRLSVGLENAEDLAADILQALDISKGD